MLFLLPPLSQGLLQKSGELFSLSIKQRSLYSNQPRTWVSTNVGKCRYDDDITEKKKHRTKDESLEKYAVNKSQTIVTPYQSLYVIAMLANKTMSHSPHNSNVSFLQTRSSDWLSQIKVGETPKRPPAWTSEQMLLTEQRNQQFGSGEGMDRETVFLHVAQRLCCWCCYGELQVEEGRHGRAGGQGEGAGERAGRTTATQNSNSQEEKTYNLSHTLTLAGFFSGGGGGNQ